MAKNFFLDKKRYTVVFKTLFFFIFGSLNLGFYYHHFSGEKKYQLPIKTSKTSF